MIPVYDATQSYVIGDKFMYLGIECEVIVPINAGDNLVLYDASTGTGNIKIVA